MAASSARMDSQQSSSSPRHAPTNVIWQWTLMPEAVAPCFAQDVFDMDPEESSSARGEPEFFWLGRVPCRTVKLVGLLVGVQEYETRILYTLDDGTGVIECQHRPPASNQSKREKTQEPLPLLQPLAYVGCAVVVIGRVYPWKETRRIMVDSIVRCSSSNDEPRHWIAVGTLHRTHYYIQEPFVLPSRTVASSQMPTAIITDAGATSVPSTPSSSSAPSSPLKSPTKSPHKLRHPSRLHTRDLTDNAFRIYLKHYMDYADDVQPQPVISEPSTPTKSSRRALPPTDETPRPHPHGHDRTPQRARIAPLDFTQPLAPDDSTRGFTLSYLRRVPELALMAKRVVKAEAKRRAREAQKRAKEAKEKERTSEGVSKKPAVVTKAMVNDQQKLHPRMKRLFNWAILQLVKEGDVISWEGPVRPCRVRGVDDDDDAPDSSSTLWKINSSSNSTVGGNSTVFSSASIAEDDEDEGELTDPEPGEEAFVSLTPAVLAPVVQNAIATFAARATARARASTREPTVNEIVSFLKSDDTWRNLSEFTVKETLALLKDEGGRGRAETAGG
ncbi:hypothetical protein K438DRAFT_418390 [Mycena galopus ATCC 62051]|nr:hypothetical protein K438DRAFT_418390 [Mycena galopus ATCC 62051]